MTLKNQMTRNFGQIGRGTEAEELDCRLEVNVEIFPTIDHAPVTINESTARLWMIYLGFTAHKHTKSYYFDGHERYDEDMTRVEEPNLAAGEKRIVLIT